MNRVDQIIESEKLFNLDQEIESEIEKIKATAQELTDADPEDIEEVDIKNAQRFLKALKEFNNRFYS